MAKKKTVTEEERMELEQTASEQARETPEAPETTETDMGLEEMPLPEAAGLDAGLSEYEILSNHPEPILGEAPVGYILDVEGGSPMEPPTVAPESSGEDISAQEETMDAPQNDALDFPAPGEPTLNPAEPENAAGAAPIPGPGDDRRAFYHLDFHELDRGLSPEEQQEWNAIYASYRGRSVLTGTVVGIDLHAIRVRDRDTGALRRQEMYCAIVIPFRVRILIPETEMWPQGEERPGFVLRNIVGAKLDVVIIHVDREAGFAIGSRRMALSSRRYYFANRPNLNKPGTRAKCGILAVGPRRCLVTCHGHDINLTQREMRYTAIPDLRDVYHPGDEVDCIVKAYDREGERLAVSIKETQPNPFEGAELRHPVGSRRQGVIAGKYAGGVFCNLPDGAVCMCNYSYHYEDGEFAVGDKVILVPQRYENDKKQIYGKIVAKW